MAVLAIVVRSRQLQRAFRAREFGDARPERVSLIQGSSQQPFGLVEDPEPAIAFMHRKTDAQIARERFL
jgi:hypothetical protein